VESKLPADADARLFMDAIDLLNDALKNGDVFRLAIPGMTIRIVDEDS
jgi:hypothetical protein